MQMPLTNKSGVMGVFWNKGKQKWTAKIKVNQVDHHLGHFENLVDAAAARAKAEKEFLFHKNHGRSPHFRPLGVNLEFLERP